MFNIGTEISMSAILRAPNSLSLGEFCKPVHRIGVAEPARTVTRGSCSQALSELVHRHNAPTGRRLHEQVSSQLNQSSESLFGCRGLEHRPKLHYQLRRGTISRRESHISAPLFIKKESHMRFERALSETKRHSSNHHRRRQSMLT